MKPLPYARAICYSGYRKGQSPKGEAPTAEQIAEDLDLLVADGWQYLRMYDPNLHARRVLERIHSQRLPLRCMIGIDSDPEVNNPNCPFEVQNYSEEQLRRNAARNDGEVERLIELVRAYPEEVIAVSVGNENTPVWGAHIVSEDRLIGHARRLKAALDVPVTFCEGYLEWLSLDRLAAELDIISLHSYPYHMGTPLAEALGVNQSHYADLRARFADKQVIITELGWSSNSERVPGPDGGIVPAKPQATLDNEREYVGSVRAWTEREQVIAFLFEAFDELWKGDTPAASECNFGLFNELRQKKW